MTQAACKTCQHFHQHYVRSNGDYTWTNCGHCTFPRFKARKYDTPACAHYEARKQPLTKGQTDADVHLS